MKTFRIILLLAIISFFSSISSSVYAKDCSGLKVLSHKWIICNTSKGEKYGSDDVTTSEKKPKKKWFSKKKKKKKDEAIISTEKLKKKSESFFKKLKNLGGKNIGEAG